MNLVIVEAKLQLLGNFLDHVTAEAGQELALIEDRRLAGDLPSFSDYEDAVDRPFARIQIAARAVAYELVALVEDELHQLAHEPWLASSVHRGPKSIRELSPLNTETLTDLRTVSDLKFDQVVTLVENGSRVKLRDVQGWSAIRDLRHAVNAFKHGRGFKRPRDINWSSKDSRFPQRYEIGQDEASEAIRNVDSFFRNLKSAIERQSGAA